MDAAMDSHVSGLDADSVTTEDHSQFRLTAIEGVLAVAVTTSLDAISTIAGLSLVPALVERNPMARVLFEAFGLLPGIVIASTVAILLVVAVTELAVRYLETRSVDDDGHRVPIRLIGYGTPSILSLSTALYNIALVASYRPLL